MSLSKRYQINTRSGGKALNLTENRGLEHSIDTETPPILSGLKYFGSVGASNTIVTSGAVQTLGDKSGNNIAFTQGSAGKRPTYNASDVSFGGRPSMTFDGVDDVLGTVAANPFGALTNITAYFVTKDLSTKGYLLCVAPGGLAGALLFYYYTFSSYNQYVVLFDNPSNTSSGISNPIIQTPGAHVSAFSGKLSQGGNLWKCMVDQSQDQSVSFISNATAGGSTNITRQAFIGARANTDNFGSGTYTDILVYTDAHDDQQMALMSNWLKVRNGI